MAVNPLRSLLSNNLSFVKSSNHDKQVPRRAHALHPRACTRELVAHEADGETEDLCLRRLKRWCLDGIMNPFATCCNEHMSPANFPHRGCEAGQVESHDFLDDTLATLCRPAAAWGSVVFSFMLSGRLCCRPTDGCRMG